MIPAVIFARGGSCRYPGKNILPLNGIPLVAWSVIQAQSAEQIDAVYVSTDDQTIADISKEYGAGIIRRPDWPNADELTVNVPVLHSMEWLDDKYDDIETTVTMLPTSPIRKPEDIDKLINVWKAHPDDVNVTTMSKFPEAFIAKKTGGWSTGWGGSGEIVNGVSFSYEIVNKYGDYVNQGGGMNCSTGTAWHKLTDEHLSMIDSEIDMSARHAESGSLPSYFSQPWYGYLLEEWQCFDIDTRDQFDLCEVIMDKFILKGNGRRVYDEYKMAWRRRCQTDAQTVLRSEAGG